MTSNLETLLAAATPLPWEWRDDQLQPHDRQWTISPGVLIADGTNGTPEGDAGDRANAALIVAAVNALPDLLATIRDLSARVETARVEERAAVVAFLRKDATEWIEIGNFPAVALGINKATDAIERGDHRALKESRHG